MRVRKLATELWGEADTAIPGERSAGKGRLIWGKSLIEVLAALELQPDFESSIPLRFTHRRTADADYYFVANPKAEPLTTTAAFRIGERAPEFWWPDSSRIERPAVYDMAGGIVRLPLSLGPHGSVFVVFRNPAAPPSERIVAVTHDGREVPGTSVIGVPVKAAKQDRTMPRSDRTVGSPGIEFAREGGDWVVTASIPGEYTVAFADGGKWQVQVAAMPSVPTLAGPWEVRFAPGWDAPEQIVFDPLIDWTQHPDPGIQHYSGSATYRKGFEVPASAIIDKGSIVTRHGSRFILDLGEVRDLATVRVNGHDYGTLWLAPWKLDITTALRAGANELEIEVINVWNNRLVGDQSLPADQRRTFLLAPTVSSDAPLMPAGLLGPVTIQAMQVVRLKSLDPLKARQTN